LRAGIIRAPQVNRKLSFATFLKLLSFDWCVKIVNLCECPAHLNSWHALNRLSNLFDLGFIERVDSCLSKHKMNTFLAVQSFFELAYKLYEMMQSSFVQFADGSLVKVRNVYER